MAEACDVIKKKRAEDGSLFKLACYLGESAGVRGNRPGDELVRGDGPDQGGNRNPPPCLLSGVRNTS